MKNKLALFDFDGTITYGDSFNHFLKYSNTKTKYYVNFLILLPILIGFKLKLIGNQKAKEIVLGWFYGGMQYADFSELSRYYSLHVLPEILKKDAMEKIKWHQKEGHRVVIVSASIEEWLGPWCDENKLELICSKMEAKDGKVTGKLATKNNMGAEKVSRINKYLKLTDFEYIYAYGDTKGDIPMLALANEQYYCEFKG